MANSKINTEETILRTPTDTPANADANSVRVYTDGTHVFSRDSGGAVVNLSTGGGGGASSATPAGSIQLSDGSGGFNGSTWTIDGNGDLQPTTHVDKQLGIIGKAVQKAYYGSEGIKLLRNNALTPSSTPAVTDGDYAKIYTDGAGGTLIYEPVLDSGFHTNIFKASDTNPAKIILESGNGANNVSLHAHAAATQNQIIKFPDAKGSVGQSLEITSIVGDTLEMSWASGGSYSDADVDIHINQSTANSGEALSWNGSDYEWTPTEVVSMSLTDKAYIHTGSALSSPSSLEYDDLMSFTDDTVGTQILASSENWSGSNTNLTDNFYAVHVMKTKGYKEAEVLEHTVDTATERGFSISFDQSAGATTPLSSSITCDLVLIVQLYKSDGGINSNTTNFNSHSFSVTGSGQPRLYLTKSELESALTNFSFSAHSGTVDFLKITAYIKNLSSTISMGAGSTLRYTGMSFRLALS